MGVSRRLLVGTGGLLLLGGAGAAVVLIKNASRPSVEELAVAPQWDTYVSEARPTEFFGRSPELHVDAAPAAVRSILCFQLPQTNRRIVGARLRLYANAADHSGVFVAGVAAVPSSDRPTWQSAPAVGAVVAQAGPVEAGRWVEMGVLPLVTSVSGSVLHLWLVSGGETMANYASLESGPATAPQLVLATMAA